jgi:hypothetical protein
MIVPFEPTLDSSGGFRSLRQAASPPWRDLISFSRKLVSDVLAIASDIASVRRRLPMLYAKTWS